MRCPSCAVDNPPEALHCTECGEKLARKTRHRTVDQDDYDPIVGLIPHDNLVAFNAYRCAVFGLIPVLGLLLGPAAVVLGIIGLRRMTAKDRGKGLGHARAGIILGLAELVTNGAGLVFVVMGIRELLGDH